MSWQFIRNGVPENVELERWRWEAHYTDGAILKQFDDDGIFHQFKEIEQARLESFHMIADHQPPIILAFQEGYKLIHFYRNVRLHVGQPDERRIKLYCFGYEDGNSKVILVIMPDDAVIVTRDVDDIQIGV